MVNEDEVEVVQNDDIQKFVQSQEGILSNLINEVNGVVPFK